MWLCVFILLILATSSSIARETSKGLFECRHASGYPKEIKCQNATSCIPMEHVCDGTSDCPDDSDEIFCPYYSEGFGLQSGLSLNRSRRQSTCRPNQWRCKNGYCISRNKLCNGVVDCQDNSDEGSALCRKRATPNTCVLPPYPQHGTYEVEDIPDGIPGQAYDSFVLTVRCRRGFGVVNPYGDGSGTQQVFCVNGKWRQKMPKCVRFCKLDPDPSVTYMCYAPGTDITVCNNYVSPGTSVSPNCNHPIYYPKEVFRPMKCISGVWEYFAECRAECGRISPSGVPYLIDGKEAVRGELPWHAAIFQLTPVIMQICGGSIVSRSVVISAAHCFWKSSMLPASDFAVGVGKLHRQWDSEEDVDAQKSLVKEIKLERLFAGITANFQEDIAVLILATPINYTTFIRPVCLDFTDSFESLQLQHGVLGKVAGWGLTGANEGASELLKVVSLPFISVDKCVETLPETFREYITGDKFCAGYTNGTAVCKGDSGGGLVFPSKALGIDRYYLRGIVSAAPPRDGSACNPYAYTTFTRITRHQNALAESDRKICPQYSFQCDDGSCVDPGSDCNGRQDCADGSDESEELCFVGKPTENIKPTPNFVSSSDCGKVPEGRNFYPSVSGIRDKDYVYNRGDIPWLVAIYKPNSLTTLLCSGTLISNRHVVSVAHAFRINTTASFINSIRVKLGSHNRNDWTDSIAVQRDLISVSVIDSFDITTLANDISILTLNKRVEFNAFIRPACLWNRNSMLTTGLFVGWGEDERQNGPVGVPHILRLSIVNTATCRASNEAFARVTSDKTLCARDVSGSNPCLGDSGGGLFLLDGDKWWLRGVLSLALTPRPEDGSCNLRDYVVFTDVSQYLSWIRKVISENL